jgi:tRNA threonylcarbamoyladenosine biosynthesis protein TsaE
LKLTSNGPEETEEIGFKLGKLLRAGHVVALYGDLGAGKTTMVKGIAGAFGIDRRDVTSASYTIIAEYGSSPPFFHIDLYRIEEGADLDGTGIWDCLGNNSVAVIEWAEKLGDMHSKDLIKVNMIDKGNSLREITIEGIDEKDWHNL